jgi:uncharacterized phage protein gp47/JayE
MYENLTVESIKSDILSRLSTQIDTREGSFTNDIISAVAYKIWQTYQSLDAIIPIAFVDETSGSYIDKRCAEYGITRKAGTKATAILTVTGTNGTLISAGKVFHTSDGLQFITDAAATIAEGTATVNATAEDVGDKFNVDADTIMYQFTNISGITSLSNAKATGGADAETDESLVARLYDFLQNTATSGNAAHYKQWALSVNGVGNAKVEPLWNGPGTVKVLIVGTDNGPVDSTIVTACSNFINANRPIGANVTVASATGSVINVAATVIIDSTTTLETVKTAFEAALDEYLQSIAFDKYTLAYNRVVYMLLDTPGVIDYSALTINGGVVNITIGENQVPIMGTVVIS